ncbi:hypothetical protein Tco_0905981 [Tanacetum coccineum]
MVEDKEKRAGEELIQKRTKKQKVDDDKETAELKQFMEVILDEEEVAINAMPLAVKSPKIIDWKIHKEGKKSHYQIIYALENGATLPKTKIVEGVMTEMPITTTEEKAQRRLEVKARSTLMWHS